MIPITEVLHPADVQATAGHAEQDALAFVDAHQITVIDLPSLEQAVHVRSLIGTKKKTITEQLAKPKAWAFGLHRWFCELEHAALAPLERLDGYLAQQIRAFKVAQDRERQAREREQADQERRDADTRATHEAAQLEAVGEVAMAAAVIEQAIRAPTPVVVLPDVTKGVAKFVRRFHWKFAGGPERLADTPPALVARTLAIIPRDFLAIDTIKLGTYARAMKGTAQVPGIDFFHTDDPVR